jgi:hypothetical protein
MLSFSAFAPYYCLCVNVFVCAQLLILRILAILKTYRILYLKWKNILRFVTITKKASIITNKSHS